MLTMNKYRNHWQGWPRRAVRRAQVAWLRAVRKPRGRPLQQPARSAEAAAAPVSSRAAQAQTGLTRLAAVPLRMPFTRLALALGLSACATAAHADLWGFVDQAGVPHFAASQLDERYELYSTAPLKAGVSAGPGMTVTLPTNGDRVGELAGPGSAAPGLQAKPSSKALSLPKHLAMLDKLPGYKANSKHLKAAAKAHGVDYALLKAVSAAESGFNPEAVSPMGAIGLMQVMPATAERYGVVADAKRSVEEKLTDPSINAKTGARYLAYLLKLFPGRVDLAVAAYNAGEGAVARYKKQIPPFKETQNYVKTVLQLYAAFNPDALGLLEALDASGASGSLGDKTRAAATPASSSVGNANNGHSGHGTQSRRLGQRVQVQLPVQAPTQPQMQPPTQSPTNRP
jgi:soluble lytic murein transglycosylase-like protein